MSSRDNNILSFLPFPAKGYQAPILLGLLSVLIWSTAATIAGILRPSANFYGIVITQYVAGGLVLYFYVTYTHDSPLQILRTKIHDNPDINTLLFYILVAGFGAFMITYHALFYFAIQRGPSIPANIINYLWPIITPALGVFVFRVEERDFGGYEAGLLTLAFSGAVLIAWTPGTPLLGATWSVTHTAALAAALCAGIYFNLILLARRRLPSTPLLFLIGITLSLPVFILFSFVAGPPIHLTIEALPWLAFLGIIGFAFAQISWVEALNIGDQIAVSSLAYLTPVISTLLLNIVLGEPISQTVALGAILIIVSNVLTHDTFQHFHALGGATIAFMGAGLVVYLNPPLTETSLATVDDYIAAIFSILAGFMLHRVWAMNREEDETLSEINFILNRLVSHLDVESSSRDLQRALERFVHRLVDLNYGRNPHAPVRAGQRVLSELDDFTNEIDRHILRQPHESPQSLSEVENLVSTLRQRVKDWVMLGHDRVSRGEFSLLAVLGGIAILIFLGRAGGSFVPSLVSMLLTAVVVFVILKIRDYNYNRSGANLPKAVIQQDILSRMDRPYYLPSEEFLVFPGYLEQEDNEALIKFSDGSVRRVENPYIYSYVRRCLIAFIVLAATGVTLLVYLKYSVGFDTILI